MSEQSIEQKWSKFWQEHGLYAWDSSESRDNTFVIDTPPPTVSGSLHMGHVYSYSHIDYVARYWRMRGKTVFFPIGWDDNGLPTERLIEKVKGVKASDLPRAEFVALCREAVPEAEQQFSDLFKTMGFSIDWRYCYQSIGEQAQKVSQLSFIDLYEKGHISRRSAPTLWDPVDRTAIAQAEIEDKEREGLMNYINFSVANSGRTLTIATTRPELLPACVAVLVHPEDERYIDLFKEGSMAVIPLIGRSVPIISDVDVNPAKGSGAVMCCTFGDLQDVVWWQRHNLSLINCLDKNGTMRNSGFLDGLTVKAARAAILSKLQESGDLISQSPVIQQVKCAERSGAPIEIMITEQWYIKTLERREEILAAGAKCKWYPRHMQHKFDNWVNGLSQDWCISRQRYFGVPFPVWYSLRRGEEGKVLLARPDQLPVDPMVDLPAGYTAEEVRPDYDVMDTWATSCMTPQISSLGVSDKHVIDAERHRKLFPADLRPQSHEIIRTWAFGTIVKALYHQKTVPWHNVMISGWCLARDNSKMSKSKGNTVTPEALLKQHGTDIVRYWASNAKLGCDIAYSEEPFAIGKKLINKLTNATKFCLQHLNREWVDNNRSAAENFQTGEIFVAMDLWILARLRSTVARVTASFAEFEYHDARTVLEEFFWKYFCDNYIELVKSRVYQGTPAEVKSAVLTLQACLKAVLVMLAPIMPYITEELHYQLAQSQAQQYTSIHGRGSWVREEDFPNVPSALEGGEVAIKLLELVRKYRSQNNLALNKPLSTLTLLFKRGVLQPVDQIMEDLQRAANVTQVELAVVDDIAVSLCTDDGRYGIELSPGIS